MAPGHDEVDTADELEALPFTSITMSAYELDPKVRRALCMHHTMSPPFAPHWSHPPQVIQGAVSDFLTSLNTY